MSMQEDPDLTFSHGHLESKLHLEKLPLKKTFKLPEQIPWREKGHMDVVRRG